MFNRRSNGLLQFCLNARLVVTVQFFNAVRMIGNDQRCLFKPLVQSSVCRNRSEKIVDERL